MNILKKWLGSPVDAEDDLDDLCALSIEREEILRERTFERVHARMERMVEFRDSTGIFAFLNPFEPVPRVGETVEKVDTIDGHWVLLRWRVHDVTYRVEMVGIQCVVVSCSPIENPELKR